MRALLLLLVLLLSGHSQKSPDQFTIDLDLAPQLRYKELARQKKQSINQFINHLYTTKKYENAFRTAKNLSPFLKRMVGAEFYDQCRGIASAVGRRTSQLVVFNYMYELGAYNKFCTSIAVQSGNDDYFLSRNLDYGYQQFLANNSVKLTYVRSHQPIFQTIGHAGLIGAHTALRFNAYSVTLNERIDAGLHRTLQQILFHGSETVPYLLQKTLRAASTIEEAEHKLLNTRVCSAVYYILNSHQRNIVIQKQRIGAKAIYENKNYIVQTNTDRQLPDPDTRRDVAEYKMGLLSSNSKISRQNVWSILTSAPNKNNMTLITVLMDTKNNAINATVWV